MRYLLIACIVIASAACVLDQENVGQDAETVTVMNTNGEWIAADPAKICWDTVGPPPEGFVAVPDPDNHRFKYVTAGSVNTLEGSHDETASVGRTSLELEGGGCTCNCTEGHCDPVLWGDGDCGCMIREGCSKCTKSK